MNAVLRRQVLEQFEEELRLVKSRSAFHMYETEQNDTHRQKFGKTSWRSSEEVREFKADIKLSEQIPRTSTQSSSTSYIVIQSEKRKF